MRTLAFHVEKGGTGKTTMAGNIAYFTALLGKKTLAIDADPQGNLSSWLLPGALQWELADVLTGECTIKEAVQEIRENLYVLPSFGIDGGLKDYAETTLFRQPYAFEDLNGSVRNNGFDIVIYDMGPGISNLERSILSTVQEVIGVAAAEYFSFDGLEIFENELQKLKRERRATFTSDKIVLNRVNRSFALHQAYQEQFDGLRYELYVIGQSTDISDCVPEHTTLNEYNPGNRYAGEFQRLAMDIINGQVRLYGN